MSKIEIFEVDIPQLNKKRIVRVYLPSSYDKNSDKKYPVLYMHDGQNNFDDSTVSHHNSWRVLETMERFEKENKPSDLIIVGVDNDVETRLIEYSPWENNISVDLFGTKVAVPFGGQGDLYADFFANNLKDIIDNKYRTLTDKSNTYIAGSSMGAFISVYIAAKYIDKYSIIGSFSIASWAAENEFHNCVIKSNLSNSEKFFIYVGTNESSLESITDFPEIYLKSSKDLYDDLTKKGISKNNIKYTIAENETHSELSWRKYFPDFIEWIFINN